MHKVYLESLDKKSTWQALRTIGQPSDGLGSIKLVEKNSFFVNGIARKHINDYDAFLVLYDLRVAYSHLGSTNGQAENLKKVISRLGLEEGKADLFVIYDTLLNQLAESLKAITGY